MYVMLTSFSFSLTCNLTIPRQSASGIISLDIKPNRSLALGDTDLLGGIELSEKLNIYVRMEICLL